MQDQILQVDENMLETRLDRFVFRQVGVSCLVMYFFRV